MVSGFFYFENACRIAYARIIGPVLLDTMSAIADYIGGAIWDVSLGLVHVADYKNIVQFALDATQKLGSKLDSFLLGIEPDLYLAHGLRPGQANYTVQNYVRPVVQLAFPMLMLRCRSTTMPTFSASYIVFPSWPVRPWVVRPCAASG